MAHWGRAPDCHATRMTQVPSTPWSRSLTPTDAAHMHTQAPNTLPNFPTHLPCFPLLHTLCRACTKNNTSQVQLGSTLRGQKRTNLERSLGCHQKEPWEQIKSPVSTADFTPHNHGAPPALPVSAANCPTPWQPCQAHSPSSTHYRNRQLELVGLCQWPWVLYCHADMGSALESLPCREN